MAGASDSVAPRSTTFGKRHERRPGQHEWGGGGTPGRGAPKGGPTMAVTVSLALPPSCTRRKE